MPSRFGRSTANPFPGGPQTLRGGSRSYGSIPFANVTIMGIPWVLFCLLAFSFGLIVSAIFKLFFWTISYFKQRPKVVGPLVEEARIAKMEQQQSRLSSPRGIPLQPPPRPLSPPPSWCAASHIMFPFPSSPAPESTEAGPSPLLPGAGEFRGSRSMPSTYVPTPFLAGSPSHPNSPIHYYY